MMEMDMSAIAYRDFDLRRAPARAPKSESTPTHRGMLRRIFGRIVAAMERSLERSRQRRIEQEAGRFIASHGGRVTDDVERQLSEHFSGRGFLPYTPPRCSRTSANLLAR